MTSNTSTRALVQLHLCSIFVPPPYMNLIMRLGIVGREKGAEFFSHIQPMPMPPTTASTKTPATKHISELWHQWIQLYIQECCHHSHPPPSNHLPSGSGVKSFTHKMETDQKRISQARHQMFFCSNIYVSRRVDYHETENDTTLQTIFSYNL